MHWRKGDDSLVVVGVVDVWSRATESGGGEAGTIRDNPRWSSKKRSEFSPSF